MQIVRLHDPARRPASWTEIIRPGQFAVFAKDGVTGNACDMDGIRFADAASASCALFGGLDEARLYCEDAVGRHPTVCYDIFDSEGRARSPLLTIVHPRRAGRLETSPQQMRTRRLIAWALILIGVPLDVYAYLYAREREVFLPAFLGMNAIIFGLRILWTNLALRETERAREQRVAEARHGDRGTR